MNRFESVRLRIHEEVLSRNGVGVLAHLIGSIYDASVALPGKPWKQAF